jgi:hypothetical protein
VPPVELTDRRAGGGGGVGTKSYDNEKVWSSKKHALLSERGYRNWKGKMSYKGFYFYLRVVKAK